MFISHFLFYLFSSFCLASAFFVVSSKNPIFCVLFLIATFFNSACLLLIFNFEFLAISFLVVYVGAIAVLFLFILLMLNIKLAELQETGNNHVPVALFFSFIFICELFFLFRVDFDLLHNDDQSTNFFLLDMLQVSIPNFTFDNALFFYSNIKSISVALFDNFLYPFLLCGLILLLAMVSAIVLTLKKHFISKNQNVYNQILKDHNKALVFFA